MFVHIAHSDDYFYVYSILGVCVCLFVVPSDCLLSMQLVYPITPTTLF